MNLPVHTKYPVTSDVGKNINAENLLVHRQHKTWILATWTGHLVNNHPSFIIVNTAQNKIHSAAFFLWEKGLISQTWHKRFKSLHCCDVQCITLRPWDKSAKRNCKPYVFCAQKKNIYLFQGKRKFWFFCNSVTFILNRYSLSSLSSTLVLIHFGYNQWIILKFIHSCKLK